MTGKDAKSQRNNQDFAFAEESGDSKRPALAPWKLLIVDDEEEVHRITRLALGDFQLDERPLEFLSAHSGREAVEMMVQHPDVALILMDVVMETDQAGLDAVESIRNGLNNNLVRIVLRTGQPGQAPEHDVIRRYDINDYKEKTELTASKLFTLAYTSLSQFRDLSAMNRSRNGLERVLGASTTIFRRKQPDRLARGALQALATLLGVHSLPNPDQAGGIATINTADGMVDVLAATGKYANAAGRLVAEAVPAPVISRLESLGRAPGWEANGDDFVAQIEGANGVLTLFFVGAADPLREVDPQVIQIFLRHVGAALDNAQLHQEIDKTQRELIVMMSEAIEKRSQEAGHHVRRVGEYARLLGVLSGLPSVEAHRLYLAAPLHDAGKIAIPDAILNKEGKHTPEERAIMETHAAVGAQIFSNQELPFLKAAAIIAGQHHERWDGKGYPNGLKGEEIHLYGRITGLVDVFDALGSERCYKESWPLEQIVELLREEKGKHFDPKLVDLMLDNLDRFREVRDRLQDPEDAAPLAPEIIAAAGDQSAAG